MFKYKSLSIDTHSYGVIYHILVIQLSLNQFQYIYIYIITLTPKLKGKVVMSRIYMGLTFMCIYVKYFNCVLRCDLLQLFKIGEWPGEYDPVR